MRRCLLALVASCSLLTGLALAQPSVPDGHSLVLLRSDGGAFYITARRDLPGPLPLARPRPTAQGWSFEALDAAGVVIHRGNLPNPHVVRGSFRGPRGETSHVHLTSAESKTFAIRVPSGTHSVVLYDVSARVVTASQAGSVSARGVSAASASTHVLSRLEL